MLHSRKGQFTSDNHSQYALTKIEKRQFLTTAMGFFARVSPFLLVPILNMITWHSSWTSTLGSYIFGGSMVPICFGYKLSAVLGASQVVLSQVALQPQPRGERAAAADGPVRPGTVHMTWTCQVGCAGYVGWGFLLAPTHPKSPWLFFDGCFMLFQH